MKTALLFIILALGLSGCNQPVRDIRGEVAGADADNAVSHAASLARAHVDEAVDALKGIMKTPAADLALEHLYVAQSVLPPAEKKDAASAKKTATPGQFADAKKDGEKRKQNAITALSSAAAAQRRADQKQIARDERITMISDLFSWLAWFCAIAAGGIYGASIAYPALIFLKKLAVAPAVICGISLGVVLIAGNPWTEIIVGISLLVAAVIAIGALAYGIWRAYHTEAPVKAK